jgi:hypothetical protein
MDFTHLQIEWNSWLGATAPRSRSLCPLSSNGFVDLNPPPPEKNFRVNHWTLHSVCKGTGKAAVMVAGGWSSQISRQSVHEGGKIVSPTHRPPLPPQEIFLVLILVRGWVNSKVIVRIEGLGQLKIPVIPSGIEPATFRLVAQCLNQLCHQQRAPQMCQYEGKGKVRPITGHEGSEGE